MLTCNNSNHPTVKYISLFSLIAILACAILAGCQPIEDSPKEPVSADTYFPIQLSDTLLHLQLAITQAEQQKGLMFRKELAKDHGMLFLSERPRQQGFWMKNTHLPLDIGYFDAAGKLVEVHKLFPYDETAVFSSNKNILIAIETNRGWYAENGVKPGAQLNMEALKTAIAKRGHSPTVYPIED